MSGGENPLKRELSVSRFVSIIPPGKSCGHMVGNHISDSDSPKMQSEIHRIYTSKIKEFYSKANQIVEEHRDLLVRIAHLLVE